MTMMWNQFRRLLLGTVIEALIAQKIALDFSTVSIFFDPSSEFKVPRLDNYMHFIGNLSGTLLRPMEPAQRDALLALLRQAWPDLLAVVDLPIGDRLTSTRNDFRVEVTDTHLAIRFDLEAD